MKKSIFQTNHIKEHERRQAESREQLGFQGFLIHRFLVIMLFVVISECLVISLLDMLLIPYVQERIAIGGNREISLSVTEGLLFLGLLLIEMFLMAIQKTVPSMVGNYLHDSIRRINEYARKTNPNLNQDLYNIEMGTSEIILLLILILLIIIAFLVPLIISSVWFSRIIVNEVHRNEQKREEMRQEYERKRNLMLSDIAHDLRTPITTIAGYSKALKDGMVTDEEKTKEYLDAIESKSHRMSELINLLFDYVKMDSAGFSLKMEQVNLTELLRENAAVLYSDVEEKGMRFEVLIPEETCMVELDQLQISRVITNLIGNAIRHNESGTTITLQVLREKEEVRIVVADDGEVIEDYVAEHIFEPFMVGDASRMTKGGSGLGLSIVKRIIDMHGWEIELKQNSPGYKKAFIIKLILQE